MRACALLLAGIFGFTAATFRDFFGIRNFADTEFAAQRNEIDDRAAMFPRINITAVKMKLAKHREKWAKKLKLQPKDEVELGERLTQYRPKTRDRVRAEGDTLYEVNQKANLSDILYQGDIALTEDQAEALVGEGNSVDDESGRKKRQAYRDRYYPSTIWGNMVYYYFDASATSDIKNVFTKAVQFWKQNTCIDFTESSTAFNRIRVFKGQGCYSYIGMIRGVQDLSLGTGCDSVGTAAHELGHALGFFHTQSRYDRDTAITVNINNIDPSYVDQFDKETSRTNYNYGMPYDYGSIMQYGGLSASKNNRPTMVAKDIKSQDTMGSDIVAFYDVSMMNEHYQCKGKCQAGSAQCQNGGYPNPRNCAICNCPSGYGGQLCDQRPPGCGSTLQATQNVQTLRDTVGLGSPKPLDDFTLCNYWIQAPAGKRVQLQLRSYTGFYSDGCPYGGVEIKTHADQLMTGYRFCSNTDTNTSLVSSSNTVPVITFNRISQSIIELDYKIADDNAGTEVVNIATPAPTVKPVRPFVPCRDNHNNCVILQYFGYCQMKHVRQRCRYSCNNC